MSILENLNNITSFIANHPYIFLAAITSSAVITYFYYDAIINYLIKLGSMVKSFIKTSTKHAEATDRLLENEKIIKDQITFLLDELPKINDKGEQLQHFMRLKQILNNITTMLQV